MRWHAMPRYYARRETRQSSTAIPLNGMPRANKPRWTSWAGNECHLPMGGSPFIKNYDNRPLFYNVNDAITTNWLLHRPRHFTMPRATSCRNAVRMRQFDAHHRAIYIATSHDDDLPRSIPITNAYPWSAAMPANRSIQNAILPTHTEWTTTVIGSPLATHTNFAVVFTTKAQLYAAVFTKARLYAAVLMHQSTTNHAAVSTHQCSTIYAAVFHTKALLLYMLRYSRTNATNYTAVFITNALQSTLRCLRTNALLHMLRCLIPKL